MNGYPLALIL